MSCFVFIRKFLVTSCALSVVSVNLMMAPQIAHADSSWVDLLKPLVKDVLVPGATMGMKKLKERNDHKLGIYKESDASNNPDAFSSSANDAANSFTSEEPITHNSNDFEDRTVPTPERGASESISSDASEAKASALPPPPPVETP